MLARMAEPIVVGPVTIPEADLTWRFSRASGPGGQSVNTTDSRVELVFDLAGSTAFPPTLHRRALARLSGRLVDGAVVVVATEHRSQLRNREAARERLAELLAQATAAAAETTPADQAQRLGQEAPAGREIAAGAGQAAAPGRGRLTRRHATRRAMATTPMVTMIPRRAAGDRRRA
jgi:ribosome-associated protein